MKKIVLILAINLNIFYSQFCHSQEQTKWITCSTGKYHYTRVNSFYSGVKKLNKNNLQCAAGKFQESLSNTFKFNFPAYNNYGVSEARLANYDQAIGLFKKSTNAGGDPVVGHYNIFICLLNNRKYVEALIEMEMIPGCVKANHPEATAFCYLNNNNFYEAEKYYKAYFESDSLHVSDVCFYNASLAGWVVSDTHFATNCIDKAIQLNPGKEQYWLHKGKMYMGFDPFVSIKCFKRALRINPGNMESIMGLGYSYISAGKGKSAVCLFNNLEKKGFTKNPDIYQALAIAYNQCNETFYALAQMEFVNKLRPFNQKDERVLGDCYLNLDSIDQAYIHYQNALQTDFEPDAELGLAIIYFLKDKTEESLAALENIEIISPGYKFSSYAMFLKAMIYYRLGQYEEFSAELDKSNFGKSKEASQLMVSAMKALSQFQFAEARHNLKKALKLEPDNVNLHLIAGTLAFETGDFQESISIFRNALNLDPENIEIMNSLALAESKLGNTEHATSLMQNVLIKDRRARYLNNMALILFHVGDSKKSNYEEACGYFESGIQYVDSALSAGASEYFVINKGNLFYLLKDTENAQKCYNQLKTPFSLNNTASLNYLEGNHTKALDYINEAIETSGKSICPTISINKAIFDGNNFGNSSTSPGFIYLFQFMPAVLPSQHIFSYTFVMKNEVPAYQLSNFIIYNSLDGDYSLGRKSGLASL